MSTSRVNPLTQLLARVSSQCSSGRQYSLFGKRSLKGTNAALHRPRTMATLDIASSLLSLSEVTARLQTAKSVVQHGLQRRSYHQYNVYPPMSFWQRNKPDIVVGGVIGICCAGFVGSWWAKQRAENLHDYRPLNFIRENFVCSIENVREGRHWVELSSSITHFSPTHLAFNIFTLWSFGRGIVGAFGAGKFFSLWVTSSVLCSGASLWWEHRREEARASSVGQRWDKREPEKRKWFVPKDDAATGIKYGGSIGASGALMGMLGAWMCVAPKSRVNIFPFPVSLPIWAYTAAFTGFSLYCMDSGMLPGIGHAGHLGGLVGGIITGVAVFLPYLRRVPRF